MIVVKLEMWPKGNEGNKYPLGEIRIANIGGDERTGNYSVTMMKRHLRSVWRIGTVEGFKRKTQGPYDLLLRALISCVGERAMGDVPVFDDVPLVEFPGQS